MLLIAAALRAAGALHRGRSCCIHRIARCSLLGLRGTAALRLILRGTFDRHPELQLVLGHWGELLPFWLDRAQSLTHVAGLRRSVAECVRENLFLTASGMFNPALLRHALAVTTPDRLLFSTDYPFQQPSRHDIETFLSHLPAESHHAFTTTNAAHLYGIPT